VHTDGVEGAYPEAPALRFVTAFGFAPCVTLEWLEVHICIIEHIEGDYHRMEPKHQIYGRVPHRSETQAGLVLG